MKKYQKDAQNRYNSKFDIVQARLPKGTKERIQSLDCTVNAFIVEAVESMLKSLETPTAPIPEPTESVSQIVEEKKEVVPMTSAEVMPWEEGFVDPLAESEEEKKKEKSAKFLARKYGEQVNDIVIQKDLLATYSVDILAKANEYVKHPELLEEPEQEQPKQEDDKITLENWQKQIDENRAEEIKKLEEEEEQRKKRREEWQASTKNDILNYATRIRNGSEMTEEEKKKEAEREEWKKKNNKEFGV